MELQLYKALKLSRKRYKPSSLAIQASRWRKFSEAAAPFLGANGWLDEEGLRQTLEAFDTYTTRKRHFLLYRWVVRTLTQHGRPTPDPTPALEREFVGDDRTLHAVTNLDQHIERLAAQALKDVRGWKGTRLAAMVRLLGDTGLGNDEVRLLPLNAVSLPSRSLTVTPRKGDPRVLPLKPLTVQALSDWLDARPPCAGHLLFVADASLGKALDPATLWRQLKRLEATVGELDAPMSGTTAIRAALASKMRAEGAATEDIQALLGHRQMSSTAELLGRVRDAGPKVAAQTESSERSTSS